jgi:hypothetical protein
MPRMHHRLMLTAADRTYLRQLRRHTATSPQRQARPGRTCPPFPGTGNSKLTMVAPFLCFRGGASALLVTSTQMVRLSPS